MDKLIHVVIRYSLVTESGGKAWVSGRNSDTYEDYKAKILDLKRLRSRRALFESITLKSLDAMKKNCSCEFRVSLLASEGVPAEEQKKLNELASLRPWMDVEYCAEDFSSIGDYVKDVVRSYSRDMIYATVRLDDDDALRENYSSFLEKYLVPENVGCCVSFGNGFAGIYDGDTKRYTGLKDYYYPKVALGLAFINCHLVSGGFSSNKISVYNLGNHTKVDCKVPVILDSRERMFVRTMHDEADTAGLHDKKLSSLKEVNLSALGKGFGFLQH